MTDLYPIGTKLITRRLSQASLYVELFGEKSLYSSWVGTLSAGFNRDGDAWVVFVWEENQKWLSPVPMVGDLVLHGEEPFCPPYARLWEAHLYNEENDFVEKRTYPSGQRAPLIEWDEVILPGDTND